MTTPAPGTPESTPNAVIDDYRVDLDAYNGPLDLLLFLVKRDEIDLHDIPIAKLAQQYLDYLKLLKHVDVEIAGEFLVMAATLLEIKSQMLLPPRQAAQDQQPETPAQALDPRYDLVQQLLAYKRYKDAAGQLEDRRHEWESRFPCHPSRLAALRLEEQGDENDSSGGDAPDDASDEVSGGTDLDMDDVSIADLCDAFARILETIGSAGRVQHQVVYDDTPIALHASDIMDRLEREGPMTLQQIFIGRDKRVEMIGLFLATLELVRLKKIKVLQDKPSGEIRLEVRPEQERFTEQDNTAPDWRDPKTGEVAYDWPSEEAKKRAERRAHLRGLAAQRAARGDHTPAGDEEEIIDLDETEPPVPAEPGPDDLSLDGEDGGGVPAGG